MITTASAASEASKPDSVMETEAEPDKHAYNIRI